MQRINENSLARKVSESEEGSVNLDVAQIKEVIKITLDELALELDRGNFSGVAELIERHKPQ